MSKYETEFDRGVLGKLKVAVENFKQAQANLEEADRALSVRLVAAREAGMSWGELKSETGLTLATLRQRTHPGPRTPRPKLAGHVGLAEASRMLGLSPSRVGVMTRRGLIPFVMAGQQRLYPLAVLRQMARDRGVEVE